MDGPAQHSDEKTWPAIIVGGKLPSYIFSKKHEGMFLVELIIEYFLQLFQFKTGVTRELHVLKHSSSRKLLLHVGFS